MSVGSAVVTLFDLAWVQTPAGLAFYAAWNLLVVAIMVLVARRFRSGVVPPRPETAGRPARAT